MKINNKSFEEFGILGVQMPWASTMGINNNISIPDGSYWPILGTRQLSPHSRNLIVDFTNEEDMSNFTVEIVGLSVLDLDDGYLYRTYLNGTPEVEQHGIDSFTVAYPVYVIKTKSLVILRNVSNQVEIQGNVKANIKISVSSQTLVYDVNVNGITISELKANDPLVIDGIEKLVYYSSNPNVSAFDNVLLTDFPSLEPGINTFSKSDGLTIDLEYFPIFM